MIGLKDVRAARRSCIGALALGVTLLVPPGARAAVPPFRVPSPVSRTLANGVRVLVFPDARLPLVQMQLRLPAGAEAEPAGQNGVATITARMLLAGTTSRDADTFDRDLSRLGGSLNLSVDRDVVTLSAAFLARDFEDGLELLSDAVARPIFPDREMSRTAARAGRDVLQLRQNPFSAVEDQLWLLALPGPAGNPPLGTPRSLERITLDQVRAFHRERYRPQGAVLAIAGDVTADRAFAAAEEWLGHWSAPGGAVPPLEVQAPAPAAGVRIRVVNQPGFVSCAIGLGLVVPGCDAPDEIARLVAVRVFEQGLAARMARAGMVGRDARSTLGLLRGAGLWTLEASAPVDSAAVLARRLRAELRRFLGSAPNARDVAGAEQAILRSYPLAFETADALLSQWLIADGCGFPDGYFESFRSRVGALGALDLNAAARRGADLDRLVIVAVGPAERLVPLLKSLGPVDVVEFDQPRPTASSVPDTLAPPTPEQATRARSVLAQALTAHGGLERLKGVTTSVVDADVVVYMEGSPITGTLRQVRKEPFKMLFYTTLSGIESRQVLDGNHGWSMVARVDSVFEADSAGVAAMRSGFVFDVPHLLLAAANPKSRVAARGRERISDHEADRIDVVTPAGERRTLYFDATSHLLLAVDHRERGPGGSLAARRLYRDYRLTDGVQWPFDEERQVAGQPFMKLTVNHLLLNVPLSDLEFQAPRRTPPKH